MAASCASSSPRKSFVVDMLNVDCKRQPEIVAIAANTENSGSNKGKHSTEKKKKNKAA